MIKKRTCNTVLFYYNLILDIRFTVNKNNKNLSLRE